MTTPLKTKASILVEWVKLTDKDPEHTEFYEYNDLGIPLAIAINADACTPTKTGVFVLDETWEQLCEWQLQDPEGDYQSLEDMLPNFDFSLGDEDEDIRSSVAANNEDEFTKLLLDLRDTTLRREFDEYNNNCSVELLQVLAKDKHVRVRGSIAMNRNTPNRVLEDLAKDKEVSQYLSQLKEIPDLFRLI